MKRKWNIKTDDTDGGEHTVEYSRSFFGIVRIKIDSDSFKLGYVGCFSSRCEPFRVGDSACMLSISPGGKAEITAQDCVVERVGAV